MRFASALLLPITVVAAACGSSTHARPQPAERHLVYVAGETAAKASVWIADVTGAHPRRLTRGSLGVLSPDGGTVAVGRRDGVYLISSRGTGLRRLTARHLQPRAWSTDGETLIATRSTPNAVVSLVAIERRSGRVRVIARGSLYGVDVSPKGDELVYSRAPEVTPDGICGDQFDLYVSKVDGGSPSRLTHDGLSAFPVWGSSGIAYSHFHTGGLEDCSAAGIWTIDSDGSNRRPIIARAPEIISTSGYFGLQPLAWLNDDHLLAGVRSEWGTEGAVLNTKSRALRRLGDYAEEASSDGRFSVGSGGDEGIDLYIKRISDGRRVLLRKNACCPDWNR